MWRTQLGIDDIRQAADRLGPLGVCTPIQENERLSQRTGARVYLKREDLQAVRSYKIRGAFNFIVGLPPDVLASGVVCASAGNHGQGVAWSCRHLGVRGAVFVPERTPRQKVARIRALAGALVDLHIAGESFDDANAAAAAYAQETGATVVPTFDHPATIAGQGTVALEVMEQLGAAPDVIVVPVGGGGLVSGVAVAIDGLGALRDIVGCSPRGRPPCCARSRPGDASPSTSTTASSTAPWCAPPASSRWRWCATWCRAWWWWKRAGCAPSSSSSIRWTASWPSRAAPSPCSRPRPRWRPTSVGRTVVCILSGGNNDVARYDEIIERSLVHQGLKHYFVVAFPQRPGALRQFLDHCLGPSDDIVLFEYMKKNDREFGPALVGIELADRHDLEPLLARIAASGLAVEPLPPDSPLHRLLV